MKPQDRSTEEAIRRLLSYSRLEAPANDFASRIMERVLATEIEPVRFYMPLRNKLLFALAGVIILLMMFFPAWTLFDFNLNPGTAALEYLRQFAGYIAIKATSLFNGFSINKLPIAVPIAFALTLLLGLDQLLRKPAARKHATA